VEVYWRIRLADLYSDKGDAPDRISDIGELRELMLAMSSVSETGKNLLLQNVRESIKRKTICWTSKGYIDIIQGSPSVTDVIFIVRGSSVPLVLHSVIRELAVSAMPMSISKYSLVGPARVDSIIDGKALQESLRWIDINLI
jgi:hypothetical protein